MIAKDQLSKAQLKEYQQIIQQLPADLPVQQLCLNYFIQFKKNTPHISTQKLPVALKCAFYMAEKSQVVYNLKGQKVKGIGLSLNSLLKEHRLYAIVTTLKQFLKKVKITQKDAQQDISQLIQEIDFLLSIHNKFEKIMQRLQLKQNCETCENYIPAYHSFIWLLYIEAKNKILCKSRQTIDNICMLAQIIAFVLIYSWEYARPTQFLKSDHGEKKLSEDSNWKEISYVVKQRILDMFLIRNMDVYSHIAKSFQQYFQQLVETNIIKVSQGKVDFLSPQHLILNYKRLDHWYQKSLNPDDLDLRVFLKQKIASFTPSRITPFARQGYINKFAKSPNNLQNKDNISSHRILTYQSTQHVEKQTPLSEMKIPKNIIQNKSNLKYPLIISTPITNGMEMYNYLVEKTRKYKDKTCDSSIVQYVQTMLQKQKKQYDKFSITIKKNLILGLYNLVFEEYTSINKRERNQQKIKKALLAFSMEIIFFVSNISTTFQDIEKQLNLDIIQEWKGCEFFLNLDKMMPATLKLHLLDLEVQLVSYKAWKDNNLLSQIYACANNEPTVSNAIQRCFKRILHQIAYQILQLKNTLGLSDKISQRVFQTMKQLISTYPQMLIGRHIDQFIICSIYAQCRLAKQAIKFNKIKQAYEDENINNKNLHNEILYNVYLDPQEHEALCDKKTHQEHSHDIIFIYNKIFLAKMERFIHEYKDDSFIPQYTNKNQFLRSPLKTIIPKQVNHKSINDNSKAFHSKVLASQTSLLYAYNESPILKYEFSSFRGPLHSKKVIDFDEQQQRLMKYQTNNCPTPEKDEFIPTKFSRNLQDRQILSPTNNKAKLLPAHFRRGSQLEQNAIQRISVEKQTIKSSKNILQFNNGYSHMRSESKLVAASSKK